MKNISFDNPYLLLLIIPIALILTVPFVLIRNKDNRSVGWTASLFLHLIIAALVTLAVAGLSQVRVLTKTTVYVLADVSYSSDRSDDEIDAYVRKIKDSLPENSELGVVAFGKDCVILTPAGRTLKSVSEATVDDSATNIVGALNFTAGLFNDDCIKRIVLITDGNDTTGSSVSSIAETVENITESGIKLDAIFLDNSLADGEKELQLLEAEASATAHIKHKSEARFLIQSSESNDAVFSLYGRPISSSGAPLGEYELLGETVITADAGLTTVRMSLPTDAVGVYEYKAQVKGAEDISEYNNTRTFTQRVVGEANILLVTGSYADEQLVRASYGESATIDSYVISGYNGRAPVNIEELIKYDEIVLSNLDVRNIRNANAFIDAVSTVVSQYGKSLVTLGNLELHTNSDDPTFKKLEELLPLNFGSTGVDGRLYTLLIDSSHSMFMADKFSMAKDAIIKLLSIIEDDDYICLVTFSGKVNVRLPERAGDAKDDIISYINSLSTSHGTDIAMGLEGALSAINALNLSYNQVMIVSDGLSFDSDRTALEVATDLYAKGATVSAVNIYSNQDSSDGMKILSGVVGAGEGGKFYRVNNLDAVSGVIFGEVAEDFSDVVIHKDSSVAISKPGDSALSGISSLPKVSDFILSIAKYDATVPLSVTYLKDNGYQETVPLYAYRSHGNGRVASLATSLSSSWTGLWSADEKEKLLSNLLLSNTPKERIDIPLLVNVESTDYSAYLELVPSVIDPSAVATVRITYPTGRAVTRSLSYDGAKHIFSFATEQMGTYKLSFTYTTEKQTYIYNTEIELAYLPEYDMFTSFDKYNVYQFMRDNGDTLVDDIPSLKTDMSEVSLYKQSYVIPLLAIASALFVVDIIVRKLRFGKKQKARANERRK